MSEENNVEGLVVMDERTRKALAEDIAGLVKQMDVILSHTEILNNACKEYDTAYDLNAGSFKKVVTNLSKGKLQDEITKQTKFLDFAEIALNN